MILEFWTNSQATADAEDKSDEIESAAERAADETAREVAERVVGNVTGPIAGTRAKEMAQKSVQKNANSMLREKAGKMATEKTSKDAINEVRRKVVVAVAHGLLTPSLSFRPTRTVLEHLHNTNMPHQGGAKTHKQFQVRRLITMELDKGRKEAVAEARREAVGQWKSGIYVEVVVLYAVAAGILVYGISVPLCCSYYLPFVLSC